MLAAAKGVVGATTVTMGLIMLPAMIRFGYDPRLAAGTVAATATLAQIFPPATVLVLLGDQLGNAYQAAQLSKGVFAPQSLTVSDLFAGALVPAFTLVLLYLLFLVAVAVFLPKASPALPPDPKAPHGFAMARRLAEVLVAPLVLIVAVLGSILGGIATPTEAASIGAVGAILLAARKAPLATLLRPVCETTAQIVSMIFLILIGATMFSLVFRALGGDDMVHRALSNLPGGPAGAVLAVMLAMFLLGFVMDAFEIIFVVVPIVAPTLLTMPGVDPVWLGVMMAVNLQTSYMHPPLGPTLVLLARRRAAADHHAAHLCGHHSICADPAIRADGALVCARARDRAAARNLWPLEPQLLDHDPEPYRARRQQREADRGGPHIFDAFDDGIIVAGNPITQLFDCRVEQLDNHDEDDYADQRETLAHVRRQEKSQRDADDKNNDLLPKGLFRLRDRNQAIPAIDRRPP